MKKTLTILALALAVGCVAPVNEKEPTEENCGACEQNNTTENNTTENNETPAAGLKGSFVSGHLGNYMDCPAEGYSGGSSDADGAGAAPPGEGDFAPCASEDGTCGGPLNCEGAQLTIRLTNGGEGDASNIQVTRIEIFTLDGELIAELPVVLVSDAATNEVFAGNLAAGSSVDLRVDYRGPVNLYELLPVDESGQRVAGSESALIEITVSADDHDDVAIDGGEVFVLPSVVT